MEKRKFVLINYADMHEEKEVTGKDGTKVTVRNHIPYSEKEAMAYEMAERMIIIHDESCVYISSAFRKFEMYLIAKYYTDIDTDGVNPEDVSDFFINNEIMDDIESFTRCDYAEAEDIFWRLEKSFIKTYEDDKSIKKAIKQSFGFLFNGEDVTESMAKAEGISRTLLDAMTALRESDAKRIKNVDNGKVTVGGNVISFAKKE